MFSIDAILAELQNGRSEDEILQNFTDTLTSAINKRTELQLAEQKKKEFQQAKAQEIKNVSKMLINLLTTYYDIEFPEDFSVEEDEWVDEFDNQVGALKELFNLLPKEEKPSPKTKVSITYKPAGKPTVTYNGENVSFEKAISDFLNANL